MSLFPTVFAYLSMTKLWYRKKHMPFDLFFDNGIEIFLQTYYY